MRYPTSACFQFLHEIMIVVKFMKIRSKIVVEADIVVC
jgi:hypothetical protein